MPFHMQYLSIQLLDGTTLVRDFSYVINASDKIAIIGEEGVGKTTLLKVIVGLDEVSHYTATTGTIQRGNHLIGYIPQALNTHELSITPQEFLSPFEVSDFYSIARQLRLPLALLETQRPLHQLSGGERAKLMVMKALLHTPDLVVMDEPTNDLDLPALEWLETVLLTLDVPIIMISHDEMLIERVANRIIHMERLRHKQLPRLTTYEGHLSDYRYQRERSFSQQDQQALSQLRTRRHKEQILQQFHEKLDHQMRLAVRQPSWGRLLKKKMKIVTAQEKKLDDQDVIPFHEETESFYVLVTPFEGWPDNHRLIEWTDHPLNLPSQVTRFINWTLKGQDHHVIVGANGVGKTTLLKAIHKDLVARGYEVGYIPQDYRDVWQANESPLDVMTRFLGYSKETQTLIRTTLAILHIPSDELTRPYDAISGGTRAKVLWAAVLLSHPRILLLDEPTRNISPLVQPALRDMMNQYPGCVVAITHDRQWIQESSESVYELTAKGLVSYETNLLAQRPS